MKDHVDKPRGIVTLIIETLAKIKPVLKVSQTDTSTVSMHEKCKRKKHIVQATLGVHDSRNEHYQTDPRKAGGHGVFSSCPHFSKKLRLSRSG
jgi:hypothetical protein